MATPDLSKPYEPRDVEERWYAFWEDYKAKGALDAAAAPESAPPDPKKVAAEQTAREKTEAKRAKERAAAQKRTEREIDAELAVLKKRIRAEKR